jgi:RNA polymerase sigma-54 factor
MADQYFNLGFQQSMRQEQVMAPRQLQALEMLQAPIMELQTRITREMENNPVLEVIDDPRESLMGDLISEETNADDTPPAGTTEDETDVSALIAMSSDWHERLPSIPQTRNPDAEKKREFMLNSLHDEPTAQEQLLEQLQMSSPPPELTAGAEFAIGNIDEQGYLQCTPADITQVLGISEAKAEKAIQLVQSFEPPGIGARDLKECLLLQLERAGIRDRKLEQLIRYHLDDLARNRLPQVAKAMRISVEKLNLLADELKKLNPAPGGSISSELPKYVSADVTIGKINGVFKVRYHREAEPKLFISETYLDMLEDKTLSKEARRYINEKVARAKDLMESLDRRKSTLMRIAEVILDEQYAFFEDGVEQLRPLTMQHVADKLGLHETTVTRAVAGKYMQTPFGLYKFRFFFTSGFVTEEGDDVSSRSVKQKIKEMIDREDPAKPLSDNKITKELEKSGLKVARRTVAKYREAIGIPSSSLRREHK